MGKSVDALNAAINSKKIPIVTLDNKWHKLWTMIEKTPEVEKLENSLNELLKRQGKLNTESKELKKLKMKLMDEIVSCMDDESKDKKSEENKRLIEECNEKLAANDEELLDLPKDIEDINRKIMYITVDMCYDALHENEKDIDELAAWVDSIRIELKKNVVRKQEMEIHNAIMYSYMHDIFGPDVIDLFDMKYDPTEKMIKLKAIREEQKKQKEKETEKEDNSESKK